MTIGNFFQGLGIGVRGADESVDARALAELRRRQLESAAHAGEMEQRQMGAIRQMENDYQRTWNDVGTDVLTQPRGNAPTPAPVPPGAANGQWDAVPNTGYAPPMAPQATPPTSFQNPLDYGSNDLARLRGRGQTAQRMAEEREGRVDKDLFQAWMQQSGGALKPGQNQRQAIEEFRQNRPPPRRSVEQLMAEEQVQAEPVQMPQAPVPQQGGQYHPSIQMAATKYGVPPQIMQNLWMVESGGGRNQIGQPIPSLGGQRAQGHFQFIPETAQRYGVQVGNLDSEAEGAARYLSDLYKRTGSWEAALAAYGGHSATSPTRASYIQKVMNGVVPTAQAAPQPVPQPAQTQPTAPNAAQTPRVSSIQFTPGQTFSAQTAQVNADDDMMRRLAASAFRMGQLKAFSGDAAGAQAAQLQGAQALLQLSQKQNQYALNAMQAGDPGPVLSLMNQQMPGYNYTITSLHNGQVMLSANGQPARTMSADEFYTASQKMIDTQFRQQWTQFQMARYESERKHQQAKEIEGIKSMSSMLEAAIRGNANIATALATKGVKLDHDTNGQWFMTTPSGTTYALQPQQQKVGDQVTTIFNPIPIELPQ